jgi:hypothetical protein
MNQTSQPSPNLKTSQRKIRVRKSGVHGKGVFALFDIPVIWVLAVIPEAVLAAHESQNRKG